MAKASPMTRDERASRDVLIYRLHLAGVSYRDIGRRAGITGAAVHKIVRRELLKAEQVRDDREAQAETEHLERLNALYAANYQQAMSGNIRASEVCRRLLVDMARVQGLNTSVAERLAPPRGERDGGDEDEDEDEGGMIIDLKEMRWIRNESASTT